MKDLLIGAHPAVQIDCAAVPTIEGSTWREHVRTVVLVNAAMSYVLIAACRDDLRTEALTKAFDHFFASVNVQEDLAVK